MYTLFDKYKNHQAVAIETLTIRRKSIFLKIVRFLQKKNYFKSISLRQFVFAIVVLYNYFVCFGLIYVLPILSIYFASVQILHIYTHCAKKNNRIYFSEIMKISEVSRSLQNPRREKKIMQNLLTNIQNESQVEKITGGESLLHIAQKPFKFIKSDKMS